MHFINHYFVCVTIFVKVKNNRLFVSTVLEVFFPIK